MKRCRVAFTSWALSFAVGLMVSEEAFGANGTWFSTNSVYGNAFWTNAYNWSAQPCPATNQTATFSNSGNGRTTIDLTGLTFVSNIVFDTSSVAAYTLGSNGVNQQTLALATNGVIQITSTAANGQRVNAKTLLGIDRSAGSYTFRNDHLFNPLVFAGDIAVPAGGGVAGGKALTVVGAGNVLITGNILTNGLDALTVTNALAGTLAISGESRFSTLTLSSGTAVITGTNRVTNVNANNNSVINFSGSNVLSTLNINGAGSTVINVTSGYLSFSNGGGGTIMANQSVVINGPGAIVLPVGPSGNPTGDNYAGYGKTLTINAPITGFAGLELWGGSGTYVLNGINDFTGDVSMGPAGTLSVAKIGNKGSTTSNLGRGNTVILNASGTRLLYTGVGETSDRTINLNSTNTIDNSGSGHLKLTSPLGITAGTKTLTLQGSTDGTAELAGALSASGPLSVNKAGTGTWILSANNLYTGSTTVAKGTLSLSGSSGAAASSLAYVISPDAVLLLNNTAAANNTNRLRDASMITLNGGVLNFSNDGGDADFSENAGPVTVSQNSSTIATAQAGVGRTATLRFASLLRASLAATVNFAGEGLGADERNRVFITDQPDGLIGPWATVNGTNLAAYSSALGVYAAGTAAGDFADIAAYGDTIVSNDAANVRINTFGTTGPIELSATTTRVASLLQNTPYAATLNTAEKALQTDAIVIPAEKASLTVGQAANDGALAPATAGGVLVLDNKSANGLVVNATLADNGSSSELSKYGDGMATLAGANTLSGTATVYAGSLLLANSNALQSATAALQGGSLAFDSSVPGLAFTLGALSGSASLNLSDNAATPNGVALAVGNNGASSAYSGVLGGSGSLTKAGNGTQTLSGANTYSGGTSVKAGAVTAASAGALGTGAVANDATLNLTAGAVTYSGLATALSGAGTNNVTLGTGSARTYLNGDYSGFTGMWNIGVGAAAGAARAEMNGLDNAGATINVLSNGTLWCYTAGQRFAQAFLGGGDTGESYGQLRVDNNVDWTGPVTLVGPITASADGHLGTESGTATISGTISEEGGPYEVAKVGTKTLVLTGNNTFRGPVWVKAGTLSVPSINNVDAGPGPLGAPTNAAQGTIKLGLGSTGGTLTYFGMGDTTDRLLDLAGSSGTDVLDQSGTNTLVLAGDIISSTAGNKQLRLQGSTIGTGVVAGVIFDNGTTSSNSLYKTGSGTWKLTADNQFKGNVVVDNGQLVITKGEALGNWPKTVQAGNNAGGANPHIHLDGTEGDLIIPPTITFRTSNSRVGAIFNEGGNNTIGGAINLVSGDGETILNSVAGKLTILGRVYPPSDTGRQLRLRGDGDGEIAGVIANGATVALPVIRDGGAGTWTLSASNTYTGTTTANFGTLVVGGTNGYVNGGVAVNPTGVFVVANTVLSNSANRLSDTAGVVLNGGTFSYAHNGGAASYSETAGALTVNTGSNILFASQADVGQTSIVTFASLVHAGNGVLDFQGAGLGVDERNKVMFTTSPGSGVIGLWATYNGADYAAYNTNMGVVAAGSEAFTNLAAKGGEAVPNDVIPDDPALAARIADEGDMGNILLAGLSSNSLKALLQDSDWASTVAMTNTLFLVNDLKIAAGKQDLTIGSAADEGQVASLVAGGALTLINDSDRVLTLNAGVTNNTSASKLYKAGLGLVKLNGQNTYTGPTSIGAGELEFGGASTQTLSGVIIGNGTLVKSGSGRLTLQALNTYTGPTIIRGGTLVAQNNVRALGTSDAGTVVESGATLDLGGTLAAGTLYLSNEVVTVSGTGVGGMGAIVNNSANSQQNALGKVVLAGDTTFGGAQRFDVRVPAPTLTMNGYTLTKISSNLVNFTYVLVSPDGEGGTGDIDVQAGTFGFDNSVKLNGSALNTLTVRGGALLQTYNVVVATNALPWTLILENNATIAPSAGSGNGSYNTWTGPVTLSGGTAVFAGSGNSLTFNGPISGPGALLKTGGSTVYLNGTNTYEGDTLVSNGTLYAKCAGSLPGYDLGRVAVSNGATLAILAGDGVDTGWTVAQIKALHDASTFSTNTAVLSIDTTLTSLDYDGNFARPMALIKQGTNTLSLLGTNTFTGALTVNNGRLIINNACTNLVGSVTVNNAGSLITTNDSVTRTGSATLNSAGSLALGSGSSNVMGTVTLNNISSMLLGSGSTNVLGSVTLNGTNALTFALGSTNSVGTVSLKGSSVMSVDGALSLGGNSMTVGSAGGDRAVASFSTNAYLAKLYVGNGSGSCGAVIQNGGSLAVGPATGGQDVLSIGETGGYGYYRMNGGTLTVGQLAMTGNAAGLNNGVFDLYGGRVDVTSTGGWIVFGWQGGNGVLNLFGGALANPPSSGNDVTLAFKKDVGAFGMINLLGPDAVFNTTISSRSVNLAAQAGNLASVLNLNAGTLIANKIYTGSSATPSLLNFNGGTLRANTAQTPFLQGLTAATVYGGGAVIDTTNVNVTVNQPLLGAAGYGVSSISLQRGGLGYIGSPVVLISGGSGTGATAIATVDLTPGSPTAGQVTGITVTSPGSGYQAGDALLVTLVGGGYTNGMYAIANPAALAPNGGAGGLTKLGTGTLTLGGVNTFGGETVISNGTLKLARADALPPYAPVTLAGGTLDMGGFTVTCVVSSVSGAITNGTLYTEISPAGTNVVGAETLPFSSASLQGVYRADVTAAGASDFVTLQGSVNISGLALELVDPSRLNIEKTYTVAKFTGARAGSFSASNLPDSRWHICYEADGSVNLVFVDGTVFILK